MKRFMGSGCKMHYILIIGALTMHYPSLTSCETSRQGYVQAGNQVSECIDKTLIKPSSTEAFRRGWKEEMAKPEQLMEQDI